MMRRTLVLLGLVAFTLAGCARHHVVERDAGRVDSARSVTTSSDASWTVTREPSAETEDE